MATNELQKCQWCGEPFDVEARKPFCSDYCRRLAISDAARHDAEVGPYCRSQRLPPQPPR